MAVVLYCENVLVLYMCNTPVLVGFSLICHHMRLNADIDCIQLPMAHKRGARDHPSSLSLNRVMSRVALPPSILSLAPSRLLGSNLSRQFPKMPKATTDSLPVSGLFAVAKPSGPTSMAVVETIKKLVGRSRLFVEQAKLDEMKEGKVKRSRKNRDAVKTGQGGTLDPLADGVLGELYHVSS
jgi:hypothetical protein